MNHDLKVDTIMDEISLRESDDFELKVTIDMVNTTNKGFGNAQIKTAITRLEHESTEGPL
ncbi:hypothetical protein OCF84_20770 (plasmid) [Shewanella xiamenensis]|uniref:Uncharacterized protein n=1 Tax=Shewanella xiamenensis TaxID=332186 RepID=A0ABT6UGX8_9GAMM|nr:hypothetical protein [Shewanella xiamenensis]MDI5833298.1 hypothetical protein [Shewanella xiamenensis]WHF57952.1 hypothetical protein OCF84_20770 [Shewanella xiamenensis]